MSGKWKADGDDDDAVSAEKSTEQREQESWMKVLKKTSKEISSLPKRQE